MADILICGANEGIGLHMALGLLDSGHRVAVADICLDNIAALAGSYVGRLLCYQADVRDFDALSSAVSSAAAAFGGLDAAVQNACLCPFTQFADMTDDEYSATFYVNYLGAVHHPSRACAHPRGRTDTVHQLRRGRYRLPRPDGLCLDEGRHRVAGQVPAA